jgi:hypothetical protein
MKRRKGMTLMITMAMVTLITMLVMGLHASTRDEMAIAGNHRRHLAATTAADSGIHHFNSLNLHHHNIVDMGGDGKEVEVIPLTRIGSTWYRVRAIAADENRFSVISEGFMKKADRIISYSELAATYETLYND